jgi:hypothetical protein
MAHDVPGFAAAGEAAAADAAARAAHGVMR